jgi:glycerate dehydrogenase
MESANMKAVVLDGHTLNPGDLSWEALAAQVSLEVHPRTTAHRLLERAADAPVLFTNKVVLSEASLECLPQLRYIGILATGCNAVDLKAAAKRGIVVCNAPDYCSTAVAQTVFSHLLNLTQATAAHAEAVRKGAWSQQADFSFTLSPQIELEGKIMGIVGMGKIGTRVAMIARSFGMQVLASSSRQRSDLQDPPVHFVPFDTLLAQSDVISLHCPLTEANHRLIRRGSLSKMKPGAYLINTARGGLVDEADLAHALASGQLAGAGLDVLAKEPPDADCPLLRAPNCFITPHLAWASRASRRRLLNITAENLRCYLSGKPQNQVIG